MGVRPSFTYDVYISHSAEDTRFSFTRNLYKALCDKGIRTFIDDSSLRIGSEITPSLLKAIQESRIAIIIFSGNYASSICCLDELTVILELKRNGRLVIPVFYDVDPSHLRHGTGSYGLALATHKERFKDDIQKVNRWRTALQEAANISGLHFQFQHGESEFIETIVKKVSSKVNRAPLHVANYPVGLESRVHQVNSLLDLGSDDVVHMLGIYGIGGIGKTTIAKAVYNSISDLFDELCFLKDIRENSMKYGLVHLQQTILSDICRDEDIDIGHVSKGIPVIKQRFSRKKVLLVLDDVDKMEQIEVIVGRPDWYGPGSRVIITTRDKHLLVCHGVERTYEVDALNGEKSLYLLCWNAFKTDKVDARYENILKRALTFASGLPLALQVLGSYLFGKSIEEGISSLHQYERVPEKHIQAVLKISYDSLEKEEQGIFLDIACFFNGYKLKDVNDMLLARYGESAKYSIEELIEKSLLKIDDGLVTLHNLIRDMGREIVRQESPNEPGKRSRLWLPQDVVEVLETNSGSSTIESLFLNFPKDEVNSNRSEGKKVNWDGEALKKMQNLRMLVIENGCFNKGASHLPNSLKVLKWRGYPSPSLPSDFHPKKLAILELPASCMGVIEPIQGFISLKDLSFRNCELITRIPDVSGLPNLEKLSFRDCEKLSKVHPSVGFLDKLTYLDAFNCNNLKTFPPIILPSLQQLNLSHCSALESFPEILGKMENITELRIIGSPIKELPSSIQNLNRLRKLELQICGMVQLPSSIAMFSQLCLVCVSECEGLWLSKQDIGEEWETKSLKTELLTLSYCNLSDDFLPTGLTWFANVKDLDLSGNNFTVLHACIKECHFLRSLKLDDCTLIQEITVIPCKLEKLSAKRCKSLKYIDLTEECQSLRELILDDCIYLRKIKGVLPNLDHFSAQNCTLLTSQCASLLVNQEMIEAGNKMFFFPGTKIPEWFSHRTSGDSISFWFRNKLQFSAICMCLVIGLVDELPISVKFSPKLFLNGNELSNGNQRVYKFRIATDHILLFDEWPLKFVDNGETVFSCNKWNHFEVSYEDLVTDNGVPIREVAKYSGIHVSQEWIDIAGIQFTQSPKTLINANLDPNSMVEPLQRGKIMTKRKRSEEDQIIVLSPPSLTSKQSPSPSEIEKGLVPQPTFPVKMPLGDVGRESSENLSDNEAYATAIQNDIPLNQRCGKGDDVELELVSCEEESSSNTKGSDSDDPFDVVNRKLHVSGKKTISSGASFGDANLRSIRETINALELLMIKDLSEVSADPSAHSKLRQLLDLLSASSHPKVTVEMKGAIAEFKRKVFASFHEFQATVESVNKLKNYENHLARIQQETVAGKYQWKDLKNSIKKVSSYIKAENSRKNELESEIATLRKQLATKEKDLEQLVLNLNNQETTLSTYSMSYASLNKHARALSEEADDLLASSSEIKHDGEAAEVEQSRLKWTWSIDLTGQLNKMKENILGFYG